MSPGRRLTVVAVGGNAISAPGGLLSYAEERATIVRAMAEIAELARSGARLLLVHGNGPQVGRLLAAPAVGDPAQLDLHVAQTQGELGYLLAEALDTHLGSSSSVAVVTRVLVDPADPAFRSPTKPVGPVLPEPPPGVPAEPTPDGRGWRRVVASPRPLAVLEEQAIAALCETHHVVAGGGGGVALSGEPGARLPQPAVVDKDWIAALLAVALDAARLLYLTDVPHVSDAFASPRRRALRRLTVREARTRLERGEFPPGSMGPKIESALTYVEATGRPAVLTTIGAVAAALRGDAGTTIHSDRSEAGR